MLREVFPTRTASYQSNSIGGCSHHGVIRDVVPSFRAPWLFCLAPWPGDNVL